MPRKLTTEEFVSKSEDVHGKRYDYSNVVYSNTISKVEIICPKHGSFFQSPERHLQGRGCPNQECIQDRMKKTCLEKYGFEVASKSKVVSYKIKEKLSNKTQEEKNNAIKKQEQTCLNKYGTKSPLQNPEILLKKEKTMLEKYGVIHALQNKQILEDVKEKSKITLTEKYGVDHNFKINGFLEKRKESWIEKYGVINPSQRHISEETIRNLNNKEWCIDQHYNKGKTLSRISEELGIWVCSVSSYFLNHGIEINKSSISQPEKDIIEFLKRYTDNIKTSERGIIDKKELDIYLPEYSFAIEFNGLYWHSEKYKEEYYHYNKTQEAIEKGIQLIHVFEDEWKEKRNIVENIILSKMGIYENKIYARKCEIKEINSLEVRNFIEQNHIQGNCAAKKYYSLWYNGELVSALSVNKSRFGKDKCEIVRYVNKLNCQIIGGFSRLLKRAKEDFGDLYSYADLRYFTGNIYQKYGKFIKRTKPGYFWVKGLSRLSRYKTQKYKLKKLLPNFDEKETEIQNMMKNGYLRIYDCGHNLYLL